MESFTIQCTSCESRIRVRNPNMIGQIANCPKCGSMILISGPQQITVESGNPTDSVAVTREALPTPDESLLKNPAVFETGFRTDGVPVDNSRNVDAAHGASLDDEYRLAADALDDMAAPESSGEAVPLGAWLPEAATSDPMPPPRANDIDASIQAVRAKRQESAARSRHVMLVATIALCSVLLAIGILFAFLRWIAKPAVVANNKPAVVAQANPENKNSDVGAAPDNGPADANPLLGNENILAPNNNDPALPNPSVSNPPGAAGEAISPPAATDNPTPPANESQAGGPTTIGNASTTKKPLGGSIAPSLDAVLAPKGEDQPQGEAPMELPPGLQGFSRLFNQGLEPVLTDASVPLEKAPELPADAANAASNQPGAGNSASDPIPATVDKKLSMQLSGVLINQRPLPEALTTLSLIGEVPIVADLDALAVVGASKNTFVKVRATAPVSFEAVLGSITASTKVRWVPWENKVIYARVTDEDLESSLPTALPVADLVSNEAERNQLLQGLKEVLPGLGDTLQISDEGLQVSSTPENRLLWFQLARLLETWRVARGISNEKTSAIVPKASLLPAWPVESAQKAAQTPIKQLVPSEPIARSWQRLTADARMACWVDWYGLQLADTNPRQKDTVTTLGRSLNDLLQHYANKYEIVFAIEDERALWVTSPEMHRMQPRLFVLPLGEKSLEEWTAELELLAPIHPTTGASMLKLIPTPDGQYLFVCCCRPILVEPN